MTFHHDAASDQGPAQEPEGLFRVGAWSSLAGGGAAEILASSGADWLVLDAQHGTYEDASTRAALHAIGTSGLPVYVRVADHSPAGIGRALDGGAAGVIVPLVDTPEQAARVAQAARYPPRGQRSWGPMTALFGRDAPDAPTANAQVMCAVMVETWAGLGAVREIAAVDGVDMIFVGPFDLSLALGVETGELLSDHAADAPLVTIVAACAAAGVRCGAFAGSPERADRLAPFGFSDLAVMTDAALLAAAARSEVERWKGSGHRALSGAY
ncbi:4-hydroxy-2-oxoheptanedioate aldolase [Nakamurella sp. UYEF19]|uniref:HpcH/HpaI aldolase family protein n=1 Tax=Nakamurella sp. UYEF19 TaxID=1756392 RepID=UPI003398EA29